MKILETDTDITTGGQAAKAGAIQSAGNIMVARIDTDEEIPPYVIFKTTAEHNAGRNIRNRLGRRADHMNTQTGGYDPRPDFILRKMVELDFWRSGQGKLIDRHTSRIERRTCA